MSKSPAISIIVPVYNTEPYLDACLESLRQQTFRDIEIILVDDGSSDRCPEICDAAAEEDPRFRVIHRKHGGASVARNAGLDVMRAPWVMFVDSDDLVYPAFCERALELAAGSGADIVSFLVEGFLKRDPVICWEWEKKYQEGLYGKEEALCILAREEVTDAVWNKIYRRELFDRVRFPEGELREDQGITYLLFAEAERILFSGDILYRNRCRADSTSHDITFQEDVDWRLWQHEKMYRYLSEHFPMAAKEMERHLTGLELDYCMFHERDRMNPRFREVRGGLLARGSGAAVVGWKMWVKIRLLRFPTLFRLATAGRRRRLRKEDEIHQAWKKY